MHPPHTASKTAWRTWARSVRRGLEDVSSPLQGHLVQFLLERRVQHILGYRAFGSEVSLELLPGRLPAARFYTTRVHLEPEPHLTLHHWEVPSVRSPLGMLEPEPGAPEVPLERIEAVLVPALTFDASGFRLGHGLGFYDRLLERLPARVLTVGVCPSALRVERLPREAHDQPVLWLADEFGVRPLY